MYTLVIIDDEEFILEQLSEIFDWHQLGFSLVGCFSNVQKFLEFNDTYNYDVLLSDIRLGNYSGLDLARESKKKNPEMEVILISAYSEFDFAKEAIRIKVFDYLLKPITYQSVTDCFRTLKEKLDQKAVRKSDFDHSAKKMNLLLRRQAVFDFMAGMSNGEELEAGLEKSGIFRDFHDMVFFQVVGELISSDGDGWQENILTKYGREAYSFAIDNFCADCSSNEENSFLLLPGYISKNKIIAFLIVEEKCSSQAFLESFLGRLAQDLKDLLNLPVSFSMSRRAVDIMDACLRFQNHSFIYRSISELAHKIMIKLSENNKEAALLLLRWGFEDYSKDLTTAIAYARELIANLDGITEGKGKMESPPACALNGASSVERVYACMQDYLTCLHLFYQSSDNSIYQIERARQYIIKNYMKDICLNEVADYVCLNPVYFSRFFKKNTGERFIDYLCKVRIEHAIELLKDPQNKAYEICSLVGYKSKKHFYKLFKLYTGCTPIEYRNQVMGIMQQESMGNGGGGL